MISVYALGHADAWETVRGLIDGKPYAHDDEKSRKAGYHIYTFKGGWVSDLGDRLEANFENGTTYSVRIEDRVKAAQHMLLIPPGVTKETALSILKDSLGLWSRKASMLYEEYDKDGNAEKFEAYMDAISSTSTLNSIIKANEA